jgi:hypothetical protein
MNNASATRVNGFAAALWQCSSGDAGMPAGVDVKR